MATLLLSVAALLICVMKAEGNLSLLEKQRIFDYHNYHRAVYHAKQLVSCYRNI